MEVDECVEPPHQADAIEGSIMAPTTAQGSVCIDLHPLLVLNISEHWTRVKAQHGAPRNVVGAVIGKQEGRKIELHNSFEVVVEAAPVGAPHGPQQLDLSFFREKEEQFKQVFPALMLVGWYSAGQLASPTALPDMGLHAQFCALTESPLLVRLDPGGSRGERLPLDIFESLFEVAHGRTRTVLVPLPFKMVAEEAESIGVNHVAKASMDTSAAALLSADAPAAIGSGNDAATSDGASSAAATLASLHHAVAMLRSRVGLLLAYVTAVQAGELAADQALLRDIQAVCRRLPAAHGANFSAELFKQCNDVTLTALLGCVTQGCAALNKFIGKFGAVHDKKGLPHQRQRGMLYPS